MFPVVEQDGDSTPNNREGKLWHKRMSSAKVICQLRSISCLPLSLAFFLSLFSLHSSLCFLPLSLFGLQKNILVKGGAVIGHQVVEGKRGTRDTHPGATGA